MIYINEMPPFWADVLGVDLETTSLDPHEGRILSITLSDGHDSWVFLHWFKFDCLKDVLEDEKVTKIFHNAQFDLSFIKVHLGFEVQNIYDSMLAEQVLIAAREMDANLADVTARRVGSFMTKEVRETFYDHPGFHIRPATQDQIDYMADDVVILPKIRESQLKEAEEAGCLWAIDIENQAVAAFADIRVGGFKLDVERWYEYLARFEEEVRLSEERMRNMLGSDYVLKFMNKSKVPVEKTYPVDKINFGSPDQLKHILQTRFDPTITGTDKKYLEELSDALKDDDPLRLFIEEFLNCKHWKKCITWNYPAFIHPVTGKIHPKVHQIGTDTGRTSYSDPNLQQTPRPVPNEPNFRLLWTADDPDLVLSGNDFGQQEIRIMASVSKDADLLSACNKKDVYLEVGAMMYGKEIKKSDPERQEAKVLTLAVGFRCGIARLRRQSGLSSERCAEVRKVIWKKFPTMKQYGASAEAFAKRNGYIFTLTGRRRYFGPKSRIFTEAVNTVVQGSAADATKIAMGNVYKQLVKLKAENKIDKRTRIWHVMHDELILQCHKDEIQQINDIVSSCMTQAGRELCPDVLHVTDSHSGYRWDKG